jgi:hypothetical protein
VAIGSGRNGSASIGRRSRGDVTQSVPGSSLRRGSQHLACSGLFGHGPSASAQLLEAATDNPSYRVAKKDIPFIIADVEGDFHVYDVQFG